MHYCSIYQCGRVAKAKGLCACHSTRLLKTKTLSPIEKWPDICSTEGCDRAVRANGLCFTHWRYTYPIKPYKCSENGKLLRMVRKANARAKEKGIPYGIKVEDIIFTTHCPLLGIELNYNRSRTCDDCPSLDRKIPSLGYVKGNVWVVSYRANRIKSNASLQELKALVAGLEKELGF